MRKLIDGMTNICWPDINQPRNIPSSSTGSIYITQPAASICGNASAVDDDDDVATAADDNMFHLNLCIRVEGWAAALNAKSMSRYEEFCCGWKTRIHTSFLSCPKCGVKEKHFLYYSHQKTLFSLNSWYSLKVIDDIWKDTHNGR